MHYRESSAGEAGSKGTHYLDFCDDHRFCSFTVVVFSHDLKNIGDVRQIAGKVVEIRGEVKEYDDRAEIILDAVSSFLGSSHAAAFAEEFRRGTARPFQRRKIPREKEPDDAQEEGKAYDAGRDSGRCGIGIEGQYRLHQPLPQLL
jgi:hypothetical protein